MAEKDDMESEIVILMATYNGEKYVAEQIESIIGQSYENWKLIIRDDNSTDSTLSILNYYEKEDCRIKVIRDNLKNLGSCLNFNELMKHVSSDSYIMFSDQDDVWFRTKVEDLIRKVRDVERNCDEETPVLVYANYENSDQNLENRWNEYNSKHSKISHHVSRCLLVNNFISGCNIIMNYKLLSITLGIPSDVEYHDYWIALIGSIAGKIDYLEKVTMIHRVHSSNVTFRADTNKFSNKINRYIDIFRKCEKSLIKRKCLCNRIAQQLEINRVSSIDRTFNDYKRLLDYRGIYSLVYAFRKKFFARNKRQTIIFYVQLLIGKNSNK